MKFAEWKHKAEDEQREECQQLSPYEEWDIFKGVEIEFRNQFGAQPGIDSVFCGLCGGLGPYNCILVKIKRGQKRALLPDTFLGFPVQRSYQRL